MSVTQLEAQMMAEQAPLPVSQQLIPPGPPRQKLTLSPQIPRPQRPTPPMISPTGPMPQGITGPPPPPPPPVTSVPLDEEVEKPPEVPFWIAPFTEKHREAALTDPSNPVLAPFRKEYQRQHVGLMTSSDKELIVRIQLSQLASIGEMEKEIEKIEKSPTETAEVPRTAEPEVTEEEGSQGHQAEQVEQEPEANEPHEADGLPEVADRASEAYIQRQILRENLKILHVRVFADVGKYTWVHPPRSSSQHNYNHYHNL